MTARTEGKAAPALHIERLRLVTDRPLQAGHGQLLGERFAGELGAALCRSGGDARMSIGELEVQASADQLTDPRSLSRLAATVAKRLLDRVHD